MPRFILRRLPPLPVSKLINENTDSIALSKEILEIIDIFEKFEKSEDQLKLFIYNEFQKAQDPEVKSILNVILSKILSIDEQQDKLIDKITQIAKIILNENRISNGILKPYEIYKDYVVRKRLKTDPLWRWKDENVDGNEKGIRGDVVQSDSSSSKEKSLASIARP